MRHLTAIRRADDRFMIIWQPVLSLTPSVAKLVAGRRKIVLGPVTNSVTVQILFTQQMDFISHYSLVDCAVTSLQNPPAAIVAQLVVGGLCILPSG